MDRYNFPIHSGFRRNEFRLNQCPSPGFRSSTPLGVAPNRLSVVLVKVQDERELGAMQRICFLSLSGNGAQNETNWGWTVYALISALRRLTILLASSQPSVGVTRVTVILVRALLHRRHTDW